MLTLRTMCAFPDVVAGHKPRNLPQTPQTLSSTRLANLVRVSERCGRAQTPQTATNLANPERGRAGASLRTVPNPSRTQKAPPYFGTDTTLGAPTAFNP